MLVVIVVVLVLVVAMMGGRIWMRERGCGCECGRRDGSRERLRVRGYKMNVE